MKKQSKPSVKDKIIFAVVVSAMLVGYVYLAAGVARIEDAHNEGRTWKYEVGEAFRGEE